MRVITAGILLVFCLGLFPVSAGASDTLSLDWDSAWEMALERNEQLAISRDEVTRAKHQVGEAWAGALPKVNFTGVYSHYFEIPKMILNLPPEMNIDPRTGQSMGPLRLKIPQGQENTVIGNIELQQPLYVGGKVSLALKIAKRYKRLSNLNVQVTREDLRVNLTEAFYGALVADKAVELAEEALEQTERYYRQVQDMYEQGLVSEYDVIRAEVGLASVRPRIIEAETGRDLAYKALKNLVGADVDRPVVVKGELREAEPVPMAYENARELAMSKRIEFQALDLQKKLYEGQYKVESRGWLWPNLFGSLKWETMAQSDDMNVAKYEFLNGFGGSLALQWPLFDGFRASHRAQQARVNIRNVERNRAMLERGVRIQVFQAMQEFESATRELYSARRTEELAEKGYRIAQVRYSEGVGTQLEVLDAHRALTGSKLEVLSALYNQQVARADYERAVGAHFSAVQE